MKPFPPFPPSAPSTAELPDADLEAADFLLDKADALLRRHRSSDLGAGERLGVAEDLPLLTDIVEDDDAPTAGQAEPAAAPAISATQTAKAPDAAALTELLVSLDTRIAQEVETWFANELPHLLARELESVAEHVRRQALAHLRATLLPALSEHISAHLDKTPPVR